MAGRAALAGQGVVWVAGISKGPAAIICTQPAQTLASRGAPSCLYTKHEVN